MWFYLSLNSFLKEAKYNNWTQTLHSLVLPLGISCCQVFPVQAPASAPGIGVRRAQGPLDNLIFLLYPPENLAHRRAYAGWSDVKAEKQRTVREKTAQNKLRKEGHLSDLVRWQKAAPASLERIWIIIIIIITTFIKPHLHMAPCRSLHVFLCQWEGILSNGEDKPELSPADQPPFKTVPFKASHWVYCWSWAHPLLCSWDMSLGGPWHTSIFHILGPWAFFPFDSTNQWQSRTLMRNELESLSYFHVFFIPVYPEPTIMCCMWYVNDTF